MTQLDCDPSRCGACVVHVDGRTVKSCTMLAGQTADSNVTAIEGLAKGGEAALRDNHGPQCGYGTAGMIMSAVDIMHRHDDNLDEETVRHEIEGNICRCTG